MMSKALIDSIGFLSTACISVTLLPQVYRTLRTKRVNDLSLLSYCLYDVGNIAGVIYGIFIHAIPVVATSAGAGIASFLITFLVLRYRLK